MNSPRFLHLLAIGAILTSSHLTSSASDLWELGKSTEKIHRYSTLFTAHDVKNHLSSDEGINEAITWCRDTAITKVYIETFRDGYQAERGALIHAKDEFREAGFEVTGCITTTQVGKKSTGWNIIACYTDCGNQERLKQIFEYTAGIFDEIMIDDFWFTDCECQECDAARSSRTVQIGSRKFPVSGDTWEAYRCELMVRLSQEYALAAARRVNPNARLIIKYPQWYDRFHQRGYEVLRETRDFDRIWVGTETRDYADTRWGGTVQYEAYFIMRWLGGIGGAKCGGGWYDWLGTTENTYLEQARQTILAGAKESLLFCYGGLQGTTGPKNIAALRTHIPELQRVAAEVQNRKPIGVAAYKPANSDPGEEARVFDFIGMLGIPTVPTHLFPVDAPAAFFSVHALSESGFHTNFVSYVATGRPVLITDGLARELSQVKETHAGNVHIIKVNSDPKSLLQLAGSHLEEIRQPLLRAFHMEFKSPCRVAFYPFSDGSWVVENFNNEPVAVHINGTSARVDARSWLTQWK